MRERSSAREFLQDSARAAKRDLLVAVLGRLKRSSASDQQQLVRSWTPGKGVNSIAAPTAVDLVLPSSVFWFDVPVLSVTPISGPLSLGSESREKD